MTVPALSTARAGPGRRGALPPTATTVATAKSRPSSTKRHNSPARSSKGAVLRSCLSGRLRGARGPQDAVGADGQVAVAYAGGVPDRVGDGRRDTHDPDLADALDPADRVVGHQIG